MSDERGLMLGEADHVHSLFMSSQQFKELGSASEPPGNRPRQLSAVMARKPFC